jgi:hypothetical protein
MFPSFEHSILAFHDLHTPEHIINNRAAALYATYRTQSTVQYLALH